MIGIILNISTILAQNVTQPAAAPALLAQIWNFVVLIIAFIAVVALAYFSLRLMGRAKNTRGYGGNIKVIEAAGLGFQNTVQLVKAGDKCFLIGVSRTGITLIGEVDEASLNFSKPAAAQVPFENVLSKLFNKQKAEEEDK
ncbi:MAG: flagellar biosynthetic protein FliO [Clostridiales bacterium]|nr:flagellar biosynthetic protein FliO [Clostridiales bacterium]